MAKETFEVKEFLDLLVLMEKRLLTHNNLDFVTIGAENYVFVGRVLRMFDAAKKAVEARATFDD